VREQLLDDRVDLAQAHEEDERTGRARELCEIELIARRRVPADERDLRGDAAMRHGDVEGGRDGGECGDTRHHLECDPRLRERDRLLAAASEDEGVATLQTHGLEPVAPKLDEQPVERLLVESRARDEKRLVRRLGDELGRDERVVDEGVAAPDEIEAARRDQPRVAGTGADEVDGHASACSTSDSKKSRRSA